MSRQVSLLGVLTAAVMAAVPGHGFASEWYTGAPASRQDDWIVTMDASTTVTSTGSAFVNAGATAAVGGSLADNGVRVKVDALAGTYEYKDSTGRKVRGDQVEGSALVGYEWIWREARLAGYIGLAVRNTELSVIDPNNSVVGTSFGVKTAIDFSMKPSERTMISAYGSFTSNDKAYFTRFKAGYRIADGVYVGPELAFLGNDFYNQWRIGGHITGLQMGPIQASLSAGYMVDRDQKGGAYGSLDVRAKF